MSSGTTQTVSRSNNLTISLRSAAIGRVADYFDLTRPRIAVMALITVAVGYTLASGGQWRLAPLLHAMFGITLVAMASSALNQLIERKTDARMRRTADRPLPSGRLTVTQAATFGILCGLIGTAYLAWFSNATTALLAAITLCLYVVVYTPMKRVTPVCTVIGAIPGALPPVLGWAASGTPLDMRTFCLFAILFLWQFPHFLAIAWLYRQDYSDAGLKMLPIAGKARAAGVLATMYAIALLPVSLLPAEFALAGNGYFWAALVLGCGYLLCAVRFMRQETVETARGLLYSSLLYLPLLLAALTWNHMQLLS